MKKTPRKKAPTEFLFFSVFFFSFSGLQTGAQKPRVKKGYRQKKEYERHLTSRTRGSEKCSSFG
jgi:hypothetical protein